MGMTKCTVIGNKKKDRGPTANQSGEVIKIITQTCKVMKQYIKNI